MAALLPLLHGCPPSPQVGKKQAVAAQEEERERRIKESKHLSEEELKRRLQIVHKLVDVQKELLATHPPTKVQSLVLMTYTLYLWPTFHLPLLCVQQAIHGTLSQEMLENAKMYMQEQMLRKAAQKSADKAMDAEQER